MQEAESRTCANCGFPYRWQGIHRGTLRMTYCGAICERSALGFTLDELMRRPMAVAKAA